MQTLFAIASTFIYLVMEFYVSNVVKLQQLALSIAPIKLAKNHSAILQHFELLRLRCNMDSRKLVKSIV